MKRNRKLIIRAIRNLLIIALLIWYCAVNTQLSILLVMCVLALLGDIVQLIAKKDPHQYLHLFFSKKHPQDSHTVENEMKLLVGPIEVSWLFGQLYIHDPKNPNNKVILPIPKKGRYIPIQGMYYGHFEILSANNFKVEYYREQKGRLLTFEEFETALSQQLIAND